MAGSRPIVVLDLNRERVGQVVRLARNLGLWYEEVLVRK
jgi:hypothetical protein